MFINFNFPITLLVILSKIYSSECYQYQLNRRDTLLMSTAVSSTSSLKKVNGALDSPNCIFLAKKIKDYGDPFQSPSIRVNGAGNANSIDPRSSPSCTTLTRKSTSDYDAMKSPAVVFLGIDEIKTKNAMSSPSLQITSDSKTKLDMPLSLIVGQDSIKSALILLAVNPDIGGLVIGGGKGTGKSALARALHRIMPPIEIIKGSEYNIAPDAKYHEIDDFLKKRLQGEGKNLSDLETEVITCPFIQIPVNVMEDRLFGTVDVKKTMETGETTFIPGLLANAHRGILYVDDINLIDTDLVTTMLQAITDGFVIVEREGISVKYPCKPIMIATFNAEDSELKDVFLDRIGMALSSDSEPLTMDERIQAVNQVLNFSEKKMDSLSMAEMYEKEEQLKSAIVFAREYIKNTKLTTEQIRYLCEEAVRGGCQGHRAEISAARVAKASAALEDAPVRADDLRLAVKLAIVPRSKYALDMPKEDMMPPPPPPPSKSPQPEANDNKENKDNEDENKEEENKDENKEEEQEEKGEPSIPEEFMFDAEGVPLDDDMTKFGGRQKSGKGGKGGMIMSRDRGRYLRPVIPKPGEPLRVAIDATLREAAKNQIWRRQEASKEGKDPNKVYLEASDIRAKLLARKAGSLLIFCVDASGSMALNRMNAAKGAACGLLQEAYQSRDKIALIPFQGQSAEVLLPPTRSIALAKSRLDTMPCGGGSPLAHALTQAVRTGMNAMSAGDVGRCVIVLISDGRANVPLSVSVGTPEDPQAVDGQVKDDKGAKKKQTDAEKKEMRTALKDEVIGISKQIGAMSNFKLLVIDTENKFVSTGVAKEIANAAGGRYHYIPKASADAMKRVTVEAVASLKNS